MTTEQSKPAAAPPAPVSTGRLIPWSTEEDAQLRQVRRCVALRVLCVAQPYALRERCRVTQPLHAHAAASAALARQPCVPAALRARRGQAKRLLTPAFAASVLQLVELHGCKKWALIASKMPNKGSKQCRRRWQNYLNNADAKQGGWSGEEARPCFSSLTQRTALRSPPPPPARPHSHTAAPATATRARRPAGAELLRTLASWAHG